MELTSELIKSLALPKIKMDEIYSKTSINDNDFSSLSTVESIKEMIINDYDNVNNNINIIKFIERKFKTTTQDMKTRIFIYNEINKIEFLTLNPEIIVSRIMDIKFTFKEYDEYIWLILSQMKIPTNYIRIACINLLKYENNCEYIKTKIIECIKTKSNQLDKFYFLSLFKYLCSHTSIFATYDKNKVFINDMELLNSFNENYFSIFGEEIKISNDDIEIIKELGKYILDVECEKYIIVNEKNKKRRHNSESDLNNKNEEKKHIYYYSTFNNEEYIFKYIRVAAIEIKKITSEDYRCMISFISFNYDLCINDYSIKNNTYIISKIGGFLIFNENKEIMDRMISFISNKARFDIETRINLAYYFNNLNQNYYVDQCKDILSKNYYQMTKIQKTKVINLN